MALPPEVQEKILLESDPENLIQLCAVNTAYHQLCESGSFWRERFRREGLPLITPQMFLLDWVNEYRHTVDSINKARAIMSKFPEDGVYISMNTVNTPDIFPEYAQRNVLRSFLAQSRVNADTIDRSQFHGLIILFKDKETSKMFLIYHFEIVGTVHGIPLNIERSIYMLFLFFYYSLQPYDASRNKLLI